MKLLNKIGLICTPLFSVIIGTVYWGISEWFCFLTGSTVYPNDQLFFIGLATTISSLFWVMANIFIGGDVEL